MILLTIGLGSVKYNGHFEVERNYQTMTMERCSREISNGLQILVQIKKIPHLECTVGTNGASFRLYGFSDFSKFL